MKIAPSVLTADFTNLKAEIHSIKDADIIHIDIMDGNFVPNISFGPAITKQINDVAIPNLDVHLMVLNPLDWITKFAFDKVEFITVHYEANNYLEAIEAIKKHNIKVGLSIKPNTKVSEIKDLLPLVDLVLVMSVEPGFGGQKFMVDSLDKVKELVKLRKELSLNYIIEIDGGINKDTAPLAKEAGVELAVVGSYLFNQKDRKKTMEDLR